MLPLESSLSIGLEVRDGRVARVSIASSRPRAATAFFENKPPARVLALLPTLFSLCGTAQALAGLAAMEEAAGCVAEAPHQDARLLLILAETLGEHGAAVLRDWPLLLGEAPDLDALKPLRPLAQSFRRLLYPAGDWLVIGGGVLAPKAELMGAMNHLRHALLPLAEELDHSLLRRLEDAGLQGFGTSSAPLMAEGGPPDLESRLAADDDGSYRAAPDHRGQVPETGPLARQHRQPAMAAPLARHGNGLAARFTARLVEMARALRRMGEVVQNLVSHEGGAPVGTDGSGLGRVETARGFLAHRVELRDGLLRQYRVLAPTEWNFHPAGPLARGLEGAEAGPELEWRAGLLAAALDPCVPFTIQVTHA